jgi:competence protein ComEC
LDVGQADSILLICEGKTMLIDGGNVGDGDKVCEVLEEEQIQTLDYLVCTHAHEDHVGGLAAVLKECDANTVFSPVTEYDSRAFRNFAKEAEEITVPNVGDRFDLGGAKVQVLACDPYAEDVNNTSIVLKVSYGQTSFLFTGDAEYPVEEKILDMGFDPSATVLKVGHHGSSSSTSYRFLNTVMPQYAVISVGVENTYNHPEDVILSRLRDADVKTFRTDLDGDLYCTSDGRKVTFQTPEPSINNQP